MPTRRAALASLLVVILVGVWTLDHLSHNGAFHKVQPHFSGTCDTVTLPGLGVQDIQIDRAAGIAYLSTTLGPSFARDAPERTGAETDIVATVFRLDLAEPKLAWTPGVHKAPPGFTPLGMSLRVAEDGSARLFVLNHAPDAPYTVEIFERKKGGVFEHAETINNPLLESPYAIAAVGDRQFYVTNVSGAHNFFERLTESIFRRDLSTVVYYDGKTMSEIDEDFSAATGIAASADGGRVYVSESEGHDIRAFQRDSASGALGILQTIDIHGWGGNINLAEDGALWVAVQPKTLGPRHPTQVIRVASDPQAEKRISEIYLNDGKELANGAVAAVHGKLLLIGSPTESKLLACHLSQ